MIEAVDPKSIAEWLSQIRLRNFETTFVENGYDDINFIGLDVLTPYSLSFIGIKDPATIQKVLTSKVVKQCEPVPKLDNKIDPPFEGISDWLRRLHLSQYEQKFVQAGCASLSNIEDAWQLVLKRNKF